MSRWTAVVVAAFGLALLSPAFLALVTFAGLQDAACARWWFVDAPRAICRVLLRDESPSASVWIVACGLQYLAVALVPAILMPRRRIDGLRHARAFEDAVTQFHAD